MLCKHECHFVSGITKSNLCIYHKTTESVIIKLLKYEKRLLPRSIHHFRSDFMARRDCLMVFHYYMVVFCYYMVVFCYYMVVFCYYIVVFCYYMVVFCYYMVFHYYMVVFCYYMVVFYYYMVFNYYMVFHYYMVVFYHYMVCHYYMVVFHYYMVVFRLYDIKVRSKMLTGFQVPDLNYHRKTVASTETARIFPCVL